MIRSRAAVIEWTLRCAVLAVAAGLTGCVLTRPARTAPHPLPADLAVRPVSFASGSGSRIRAWFAPGDSGRGAVLLLHGVGDNRTAMVARARFLQRDGYAVLLPDLQAHGESRGEFITFGARESLDALAALAFLRACTGGERTAVIGVSMGGAATLLGPGPLHADAFVLESVYPTIRQALDDRLGVWLGPLGFLHHLLTPVVLRGVSEQIGVSDADLRPIDRIGAVRAPLLLLAGTRDRYTPLDESVALFARASEPKEMWAVEGAGHEDLYAFAGARYERRVGGFLARQLRGARRSPDEAPESTLSVSGNGPAPDCGGVTTVDR